MAVRKFDLNVDKILVDWQPHHAIREIIANALDEQKLTKTAEPEIFSDPSGRWHIRDFGRGLRYEHLTQRENDEKLNNPHVIGKFGIGLKDALATFERRSINVLIKSRHGDITLERSQKHDFEDVVTLHAYVSDPSDPNMTGTEFILEGVTDEDIARAKDQFLRFSGERMIDKTKWGEVLEKQQGRPAGIYVNGMRVAEEDNFLFSYNITPITAGIRKALNRERSNVGRSAYSRTIKKILLHSESKEVAKRLVDDLQNYEYGNMHEELKSWTDTQKHAVKIMNTSESVVFLTPEEQRNDVHMVEEARKKGHRIVSIPEKLKNAIQGERDLNGRPIRDLNRFYEEYNNSFEFEFIDPEELTDDEKRVFELTDDILGLIGGRPSQVKEIRISETMRKDLKRSTETLGLWQQTNQRIIIKRSQLQSVEDYAGTLLHEVAHATSGVGDVNREFELELTRFLGKVTLQTLTAARSKDGDFATSLINGDADEMSDSEDRFSVWTGSRHSRRQAFLMQVLSLFRKKH